MLPVMLAILSICMLLAAGSIASAFDVVISDEVSNTDFLGIGFDVTSYHTNRTQDQLDHVYLKRLAEVNPSFVRASHVWGPTGNCTEPVLSFVHWATNASIYVTTMGTPLHKNRTTIDNYGERVAEALVPMQAASNSSIRWYCFTNEMSLCSKGSCEWAYMAKLGLPEGYDLYKWYHDAVRSGLEQFGLAPRLGQLATDASSGWQYWKPTMNWASTNSTGPNSTDGGILQTVDAWGGHDYADGFTVAPDESRDGGSTNSYYWTISGLSRWGGQNLSGRSEAADGRYRPFIIGEVGSAQRQPKRPGKGCSMLDSAEYFDTPSEPYVALQMAEMAVAAANYSISALAYWSLADSPRRADGVCNWWGAWRWTHEAGFGARFHWYALGPMVRAMRGPARTHVVRVADPHLRVAALQTTGPGQPGMAPGPAWTVVGVLRRPNASAKLSVSLPASEACDAASRPFRVWIYDPLAPPANTTFADLPAHSRSVLVSPTLREDGTSGSSLQLGPLPANSMFVATQSYSDSAPPACRGLHVTSRAGSRVELQWDCMPESVGITYYRVLLAGQQVLSTVRCGATVAVQVPAGVGIESSLVQVVGVNRGGDAGEACQAPLDW